MGLEKLASEYRQSGELCRDRAKEIDSELKRKILVKSIHATEIMRQRQRINALKTMARECFATASYLKNYYERSLSFEKYI